MCIAKIFTVTVVTSQSSKICGVYHFVEDCFNHIAEEGNWDTDIVEWQIDAHTVGIANSAIRVKTVYMQNDIIKAPALNSTLELYANTYN